jgi:hypothetical protein
MLGNVIEVRRKAIQLFRNGIENILSRLAMAVCDCATLRHISCIDERKKAHH